MERELMERPVTMEGRGVEVRVASGSTFDDVAALRADWLRVREAAKWFATNADPDRYRWTSEAIEGASPHLRIVYEGGEPTGLLIGRSVARRVRNRIGYIGLPSARLRCLDVVYGGLVSVGGRATRDALVRELRAALRSGEFDHVFISHLPKEWELAESVREIARESGCARLSTREPHWRFLITPGSVEETMAQFSGKHRRNIRKWDRLLSEHAGGDVSVRVITREDEVDELIRETAGLADTTYQAALGSVFSDTPVWRAKLTMEARLGNLRCYWLVCGGKPVAFFLGSVVGDVYVPEATGYLAELRSLSPGTVLMVRIFEDLSGIGVRAFDYGFGDAVYKRMYGSESWDEDTFMLYSRTWRGRAGRLTHLVAHGGTALAKRVAPTGALQQRVKTMWRKRLGRTRAEGVASTDGGDGSKE